MIEKKKSLSLVVLTNHALTSLYREFLSLTTLLFVIFLNSRSGILLFAILRFVILPFAIISLINS